MEILIICGVILVLLIIKIIYDKVTTEKKINYKLKKAWGDVPKQEYSETKKKSLRFFYESRKKPETDVDDITWHDLDMDQIFMTINATNSSIGEEYLYYMLRSPLFDANELAERERLIELFRGNEWLRRQIQVELFKMGKTKNISVFEYMNRLNDVKEQDNISHFIQILLFFAGIALCFIDIMYGVLAIVGVVVFNMLTYFKRKNEIEPYFNVVSYIIRWLQFADKFSNIESPEIAQYTKSMKDIKKDFRNFRRGAALVAPSNPTGDMLQMMLDYLKMIFHIDLIKFNSMAKSFKKMEKSFGRMFEITGLIDSCIAIASFRELMQDYSIPELGVYEKPVFDADELYHPMINDPVCNSITQEKCVLITGSNASGKSTFIRTVAINAILAQSIHTVMASRYRASYFRVASSMALSDSLSEGESYYIVEIKSLKRLLDGTNDKIPSLIFVDEVLRGTNTLERIAASSRILKTFADRNVICFAATHDIELTYILENFYTNYHFEEQVTDKDVTFDYELHEGRAISRNAIKLLSMLGYDDMIIDSAFAAADSFLEKGEWEKI